MKLLFATANPGKLREMQEICKALGQEYGMDLSLSPLSEKVDIPETGSTYGENALIKAQWAWEHYGLDCLADDSGLEVDALGGAPGIYTARYCDRNFASGMDKLLHELHSLGADSPQSRRAAFKCCICLIIGGKPLYFHGSCAGTISSARCGSGGFGFDPVFIPDQTPGRCMAELDEEYKNSISHRGLAVREMFNYLKDNNIK